MLFASFAAAGRDWSHLNFTATPQVDAPRRLGQSNYTGAQGGGMYGDAFEGDIELTDAQWEEMQELQNGRRRAWAQFRDYNTWHMGSEGRMWLPYEFESGFSDQGKAAVYEAQAELEAVSCVRFKERTDEDTYSLIGCSENDNGSCYGPQTCSSPMGRRELTWTQAGVAYQQPQKIKLDAGCWTKGTVLHELMHTLGFWHEHSRPDRDEYVEIKETHIVQGAGVHFALRHNAETHDHPYDYASIMHYGTHDYGVEQPNGEHLQTIYAKGNTAEEKAEKEAMMGQSEGLSNWDIADLNRSLCPTMCGCETPQSMLTAGHNKIICDNKHMPAGYCAHNEACISHHTVRWDEKHLLCQVPTYG